MKIFTSSIILLLACFSGAAVKPPDPELICEGVSINGDKIEIIIQQNPAAPGNPPYFLHLYENSVLTAIDEGFVTFSHGLNNIFVGERFVLNPIHFLSNPEYFFSDQEGKIVVKEPLICN